MPGASPTARPVPVGAGRRPAWTCVDARSATLVAPEGPAEASQQVVEARSARRPRAAGGAPEEPTEHPGDVRHVLLGRLVEATVRDLTVGREHVDDLRQERGEQRQERGDVEPAPGRQTLDLVLAERGPEPLRVDRLVGAAPDPRVDRPAHPRTLELADQVVQPALVLDRPGEVSELVWVDTSGRTRVPKRAEH